MKTPEEIKKGLEACRADECFAQHTLCPYADDKLCVMHVCGDAIALIEHLEAKVPKWISVEERLPDNHGDFLTKIHCEKGDWIEVNTFYHTKKEWWHDSGNLTEEATEFVTHWMPMPELPNEGA